MEVRNVFIAILALVAAAWIGLYKPWFGGCILSKPTCARADMNAFISAMAMYRINTGTLPSPEEGLNALVARRGITKLHPDPWGNPYHYVRSLDLPDGFGLFSTGEDGVSKTLGNDPDDVNSWSEPNHSKKAPGFAVVFFWPAVMAAGIAGFLLGRTNECAKLKPASISQ